MQVCSKCGVKKPSQEFSIKRRTRDGEVQRQAYCKECNKKYCRKHYTKNKPYYKSKSKAQRTKLLKMVNKIKAERGCFMCKKERDPTVLDFRHRPGTRNNSNVSALIHDGRSTEIVMAEIEKCAVVCANCRRRLDSKKKITLW